MIEIKTTAQQKITIDIINIIEKNNLLHEIACEVQEYLNSCTESKEALCYKKVIDYICDIGEKLDLQRASLEKELNDSANEDEKEKIN